jgi:hypothetical protein
MQGYLQREIDQWSWCITLVTGYSCRHLYLSHAPGCYLRLASNIHTSNTHHNQSILSLISHFHGCDLRESRHCSCYFSPHSFSLPRCWVAVLAFRGQAQHDRAADNGSSLTGNITVNIYHGSVVASPRRSAPLSVRRGFLRSVSVHASITFSSMLGQQFLDERMSFYRSFT